jgi:hypothetical protein
VWIPRTGLHRLVECNGPNDDWVTDLTNANSVRLYAWFDEANQAYELSTVRAHEQKISRAFAVELLTALYALDDPIGQLDTICGGISNASDRKKFARAIGELMDIVTSDLMVKIYHEQPSLGRASEPGDWLSE